MTEFPDSVDSMKSRFEHRLLTARTREAQEAAVDEFDDWKRTPWVDVRRAKTNREALRDCRLAQAVEDILDWIRASKRGDRPNVRACGFLAALVLSVLKGAPVTEEEIIAAGATDRARDALSDGGPFSSGGPQAHAMVVVAIITGVNEQTIKRAVLASKDQTQPPE